MLDNTTLLLALGLLFGFALGALTVLVLQRDPATDTGDAYRHDVATGKLMAPLQTRYSHAELTALALGTRPDGTRYGEPDRAQHDGVTIDGTCSRYNVARPFDIVAAERCANWQHCPDCGWPMQPDEHCPEWCGVAANGRRYAIVGEVE